AGPSGAGRARTGAASALGAGTLWATTAPFNPLRAPACRDRGATTPQLARGLLEGHAAAALDAARTVRWARAELERPGEAARAVAQLRALRFSDLSAEERGACAPVLLIGDDSALTRSALGSLLWLLSTDLAVKVLLLSGAGGQADSDSGVDAFGAYPAGSRLDVSLLAMLSRRAYVLQTSVAAPDHLADGVRSALRFDGPALICVHCPSPQRHGFPAPRTLDQARLAVASRSFPLLRFDPAGAGVFGSCLDLRGNPALDALLARAADGKPLTPADWAITESRFRPRFQPLPGAGTPVDKVLTKAASERDDAPARVTDPLDKSAWAADPALLAWADDRLRLWRTLQEIAGVVTPFTQRVREDAERAVADEHARQIADLKRQHETALEQLRADFNAEAATRVRDGLLALAGYSQREGGDS
ncbi:MAG: pyruvate ferredoxin oxidoreductase, partial [Phycisphaerales bacterium JB039]